MSSIRWPRGIAPAVLMCLLVGCNGRDGRDGAADRKPFKVATFTWAGYAPINLAKEKGFFEGIDVELRTIEDTAARRSALSAGQVDSAVDILDSFVCARAAGMPASVVLKLDDSTGGDGIVALKSIKSIKDLKGHSVAYPKDQPSHFFLLTLLDREGMSIKDIDAKPTNEADGAATAFISKSVDAAVTWEPWLSKAAGEERAHILTTSRETPGLIVDVFTVRDQYLHEHPQAVKAFLRGWFKAIEFWKDNAKEANEIMAGAMGIKPSEFERLVAGIKYGDLESNQKFFRAPPGGESDFNKLVKQASTVWLREGVSKKDVPADSIDGSEAVLSLK
jgi:NitT/TauT family transport system substrate-binding protein